MSPGGRFRDNERSEEQLEDARGVGGPEPASGRADRDRFLSEFALALAEGEDLGELLTRSVARLGELLGVDRVALFVVEGEPTKSPLRVRATWSRDGVAALAGDPRSFVPGPPPPWLLEGRFIVAEDALAEPVLASSRKILEGLGTRSLLGIPLRVEGRLRGAISAATVKDRRRFEPEDVAFLDSAMRLVAAALRQEELVTELSRERDRMRLLAEVAAALQRSETEAEAMDVALAGLKETLGFPVGGVALMSPEDGALLVERAFGPLAGPLVPGARVPVEEGDRAGAPLSRVALRASRPLAVEDVEADPLAAASRRLWEPLGVRTVVLAPLRAGGKSVGLLGAASIGSPRKVSPADLAAIGSLADLVAVALVQRRSAETLRRAAGEARALGEATHALLTRSARREVLLERILDAVVLHFGKENCRLLVVDARQRALLELARRGDWPGLSESRPWPLDGPGLMAEAARAAEALSVADVASDPRYVADWPEARSELVVPLRLDREVIGVLDLQSRRPGAFGPDDVRVLRAFADRAALALHLAELVEELERRARVLESIGRATHVLNFRMNAPDVLAAFVEEAERVFPAAHGAVVWAACEDGVSLRVAAAHGSGRATEAAFGTRAAPAAELFCAGVAFLENRPAFLEPASLTELMGNAPAEERARIRATLPGDDVRHLMAAPIRVGERRLGVLEILSGRPGAFSATDAETLALLAEQSAIALRNARLIEDLTRSNRLKDDFLANLSHEVRTPLTGIVGWAEVLLDQRKDDADARRALTAILGQAETLNRMLSDLIDLSRIESFGLEIRRERVDVVALVRSVLDAVGPAAARRQVSISCELPPGLPRLEGDTERLRQMLWNLLGNAVKFSQPGGPVRLRARSDAEGGLTLVVEDEGHGIEPGFLPHVFERLRQEDTSTNRRHGGLGIGLAVVRAVVAAHGGTIEAESQGRGKGSRFTVRFPPDRLAHPSGTYQKPVTD